MIQTFGAMSSDTVVVRGQWMYQSTIYSDQLTRVRVDAPDTPENWDAMRRIKETLKTRFDQVDIWLTAYRIDVV